MFNMMKDAMVIFVITLVAGLFLGGVYEITKAPIAEAAEEAARAAYVQVFAGADEFVEVAADERATADPEWQENYGGVEINAVLQALDESGAGLGYVLQVTTHEGYGGDITLTVGIRSDGSLNGVAVLDISETAGLGMRAEDVLVPQFADKSAAQFVLTKTAAAAEAEIEAISGATVTSDAFVNAVNAGLFYYEIKLGGDGNAS